MKKPGGVIPGFFYGCEINRRPAPLQTPALGSAKGGYLKICSIMTLDGMNNVFV